MESFQNVDAFVIAQQERGVVEACFTNTKLFDIWDCLIDGDDNSEDDSNIGLTSDMTVWEALDTIRRTVGCPFVVTIENIKTGQWKRTTWKELVQFSKARILKG